MPAALFAALALQAAAAPPPSPEALALGDRLSRAGLLGGIIAVAGGGEAKGVVDSHAELTPEQRARAQRAAEAALADAKTELARAEGRAFAASLTPEQLRGAVTFFESPAGQAYRSAFPMILMSMAQTGPARDFKGYLTKRVCDEAQVCPPAK